MMGVGDTSVTDSNAKPRQAFSVFSDPDTVFTAYRIVLSERHRCEARNNVR